MYRDLNPIFLYVVLFISFKVIEVCWDKVTYFKKGAFLMSFLR